MAWPATGPRDESRLLLSPAFRAKRRRNRVPRPRFLLRLETGVAQRTGKTLAGLVARSGSTAGLWPGSRRIAVSGCSDRHSVVLSVRGSSPAGFGLVASPRRLFPAGGQHRDWC